MFFDLLVFSTTQLRDQSLDDLGDDLDEKYDLAVSKQALHKRFNAFAVAFLKQVLRQLLTRQVQLATLAQSWVGSPFKRILIRVCPQKPPVRSLRGAFLATKQSPPFYQGITSAKNASQWQVSVFSDRL